MGQNPTLKTFKWFLQVHSMGVILPPTKVFADIINTRLTPVNFLSSNSVREIDLLFIPDDNDFNPAAVV